MTDVVVYGATAAGVTAAVAAREAGASTVLVEPGGHVGGMVSGGLSWTDVGDSSVHRGLVLRFYQARRRPLRRAPLGGEGAGAAPRGKAAD